MSYRFLLSRRWLVLTLVAVVLIPTMIQLGFWQMHRHEHRVTGNELTARALATDPVPVQRLTLPGAEVPREHVWRPVTATGRYDPAHEVAARQRSGPEGAGVGYYVITPLVLADGRAVLVNRGWIPAGDDLTTVPAIPKPPSGEVTVTGRLRADETTATTGWRERSGLPDRMVMLVNSELLAERIGRPVLAGHVELTGTTPKPAGRQPQPLPEPDHDSIGAHFAYALQWWLFAAMVPVGWVILARRDRREFAARARGPARGEPFRAAEPSSTAEPAGSAR